MGTGAITTTRRQIDGHLSPTDHEEADTRIMLHVSDAVSEGHKKILIRTVDTDIIAIAVGSFQKIEGIDELWIHVGMGANREYISVHGIVSCLGE